MASKGTLRSLADIAAGRASQVWQDTACLFLGWSLDGVQRRKDLPYQSHVGTKWRGLPAASDAAALKNV
eukprot:3903813-Pleurochrysis_carterae.AAC.6